MLARSGLIGHKGAATLIENCKLSGINPHDWLSLPCQWSPGQPPRRTHALDRRGLTTSVMDKATARFRHGLLTAALPPCVEGPGYDSDQTNPTVSQYNAPPHHFG